MPGHAWLWLLAVLAFGVGDLLTTGLGLRLAVLTEIGPLTAPLVEWFGPGVMLPVKGVTFCGCYALWRLVPRPHSVGVPLGLAALGVSTTCWNLHLLIVVG